jgi:hypothetical protein
MKKYGPTPPRTIVSFSIYSLLAIAVSVVVATLVCNYVVYLVFQFPLASIPAVHPLAHITSLWIQWQRFHGTEYECI